MRVFLPFFKPIEFDGIRRRTSRDDDEYVTGLQMVGYVLWAREYCRKSHDEIRSSLVFLKTGKKKPFVFFGEQLRAVEETIRIDFEVMNAWYVFGDFPAHGNV